MCAGVTAGVGYDCCVIIFGIISGLEVGGPGSCKGDSGGPIVKFIDVEDRYVLVGIVEGGIGKCGNSDYPAIYIRVGDREILSFIQNATGLRTGT